MGIKTSNDNNRKQQHNNHNFECLYSMYVNHRICVVLRFSVRHIGGWNHPTFMHKPKNAKILHYNKTRLLQLGFLTPTSEKIQTLLT